MLFFFFFFFQAEDGIRDYKVTGVQTCALPIYGALMLNSAARSRRESTIPKVYSPVRMRSRMRRYACSDNSSCLPFFSGALICLTTVTQIGMVVKFLCR